MVTTGPTKQDEDAKMAFIHGTVEHAFVFPPVKGVVGDVGSCPPAPSPDPRST
jgi:hypothetical protein